MYVSQINNSAFIKSTRCLQKTVKIIDRKILKNNSSLRNLNTRMIRDDYSLHDMLIPGGMSIKEQLLYKLTGNYPKSVTERWHQIFGADLKNVDANDDVVKVSKGVLRECGYFSNVTDNNYDTDDTFDNVIKTGNSIKNGLKNFIDDITDKIDDIL